MFLRQYFLTIKSSGAMMENLNNYNPANDSLDFLKTHCKPEDYFLLNNKFCCIPYCLDYIKKHRLAIDDIIDNDREFYLQDYDDSDKYMIVEAVKALHETSNGKLPEILDEAINDMHIAKIKQLLPECIEFDSHDSQAEYDYYCDADRSKISLFYFEVHNYISQLAEYLYHKHQAEIINIFGLQKNAKNLDKIRDLV